MAREARETSEHPHQIHGKGSDFDVLDPRGGAVIPIASLDSGY
jgi:hypothetical protein